MEIQIPSWVVDLASYRKWTHSDEFPEAGRICYLGEVWIDTSMEQLFTHNQVKTEFTIVLGSICKQSQMGTYFTDGANLTNQTADLSTIPDGMFVSNESFDDGSVKLCEGARDGFVELEGSPEMVLEIVSDSSVRKDKTELMKRYAEAGIEEYWLVDARKPPLEFFIYRWDEKKYEETPSKDGFIHSEVFEESFRLVQGENPSGHPRFRLEKSS